MYVREDHSTLTDLQLDSYDFKTVTESLHDECYGQHMPQKKALACTITVVSSFI